MDLLRIRTRSGSAGVLGLALGLAAFAPGRLSAQSSDSVRCKDGKEFSGRVERENYAGLELSLRRGVTRKFSWEDVDAVEYSGAKVFDTAIEAEHEGRVDDARAALVELEKDVRLRRPLRQEVLFRLARLERMHGPVDGAIARYRELLSAYPGGRYLDEAAEELVDLLLEKPAPDEAKTSLEVLSEQAKKGGVDVRFDAVTTALRGRILEATGKFEQARADYGVALREGTLEADLGARTRLGIARCDQAEGKTDEARARYHEITLLDAPHAVLTGAWNGLADLALARGVSNRDRGQIDVALYSYLRGVVQYTPQESERSTEHERSIAGAARAFEYVAQIETDPAAKRLAKSRALMLRGLLPKK